MKRTISETIHLKEKIIEIPEYIDRRNESSTDEKSPLDENMCPKLRKRAYTCK